MVAGDRKVYYISVLPGEGFWGRVFVIDCEELLEVGGGGGGGV